MLSDKLYYYKQKSDASPKDALDISKLNVMIADHKTGKPNCLQLSCNNRHYFVQADSSKECVDWLLAIRAARLALLHETERTCVTPLQLSRKLSWEFRLEGYLTKCGDSTKTWKKRWFTLSDTHLSYFTDPMDAFATGEVALGPTTRGFEVKQASAPFPNAPHPHNFTVFTPETKRTYEICAEEKEDMMKWISAIQDVLDSLTKVPAAEVEAKQLSELKVSEEKEEEAAEGGEAPPPDSEST